MKELFIDLETTSLNPYKGAITELAAIAVHDGREVGTCSMKLRPHTGAYVEDGALKVQNITRRELDSLERDSSDDAFDKFLAFLGAIVDRYDPNDKFALIAHNAQFDTQFLDAWFKLKANRYFGSYFHRPSICTYMLSIYTLRDQWLAMGDHKLKTLADYFQIKLPEEGQLHSALYDVRLCQGIYNHIRGDTSEQTPNL